MAASSAASGCGGEWIKVADDACYFWVSNICWQRPPCFQWAEYAGQGVEGRTADMGAGRTAFKATYAAELISLQIFGDWGLPAPRLAVVPERSVALEPWQITHKAAFIIGLAPVR
jgi:hypothetical protein